MFIVYEFVRINEGVILEILEIKMVKYNKVYFRINW